MSEVNEAVKPAKKTTVYTKVTMGDGREVEFPGDQRMKKSVLWDNSVPVGVRFDLRNGATFSLNVADLPAETQAYAGCHGLLQKVGDESSGVKEIDDIELTTKEIIERLLKGEWATEREAGDSMSGASIVIKALVEASGKDVDAVKAFLDGKLESAKAKGEKLTRQALYASFRNPTSKVGQIIRRLEEEKAAKSSAVDADAVLGELAG